ncbi:hypothetical protein HMF8227_02708 [Saliniradius amylolyticus]|uniref:CASTOR/POLLUX/SYM8 ion channel conserved domain-containing protein n=1 Tax=Saliniradius amylolyticus TaxID=2183582 RepID=A0A2S2E6C9_9ALTE|nr:ion channel DMI1 [Saliniradius amylolyticus]AWL13159.1 hypothetical protein HMF8227_02708 [Saliniradius amylolyticus]
MFRLRAVDRITFIIERQLVKGAGYQLAVVAAAIGLVSLLGGLLVQPVNPDSNMAENVWWAFLRLTDPGYLGDDVGGWRRVVSTLLTISGYVLFMGTLVAILTRWLIGAMTNLERGLTPVSARRHVVILGLDNRTASMIRQLMDGERGKRHFEQLYNIKKMLLVVLAEEVDATVSQRLKVDAQLSTVHGRDVILRSGSAMQPEALHRVASLDAEVILLPRQQDQSETGVGADIETIKVLMSLSAQGELSHRSLPRIVVEMGDGNRNSVAQRAYKGPMEIVTTDKIIGRMLAQCLLCPGFSELGMEVLSNDEGSEFYMRSAEPFRGQTLAQASQYFSQSILCGYRRSDSEAATIGLSANADAVLEAEDSLILLARDYSQSQADTSASRPATVPVADPKPLVESVVPLRHRRILVLGWNDHLPMLVEELTAYQGHEFELTVISTIPTVERQRVMEQRLGEINDRVRVTHVEKDYTLEGAIRRLKPGSYDHILLLYSDRLLSSEEADARVLLGLMLLEEIVPPAPEGPHILVELSDPANESFLERHNGDVLISPMIISHLMALIAIRPQLNGVIESLFSARGGSLAYREGSHYGLEGQHSFAQLQQAANEFGETLLGYYRDKASGLQLNPKADQPIDLDAGNRLVVITAAN